MNDPTKYPFCTICGYYNCRCPSGAMSITKEQLEAAMRDAFVFGRRFGSSFGTEYEPEQWPAQRVKWEALLKEWREKLK